MNTPVVDFVRAYAASGTARLHMPGHKGQRILGPEAMDITEVFGAGELYEAEGPVGEGEANTTALFGTAKTCWSTEGSSQCIRAMLALATQFSAENDNGKGKKRPVILATRNAHRAFLTACALLDLEIRWLWPEDDYTLCSCPVTARQVREALGPEENRPSAVYLTSPDYLGCLQDISGIAKVCHSFHVPLLVDNAHGAYLKFSSPSRHPIDLGADLCCDSAHKTLPALTGCAYLHVARNAPASYARNAKRAMAMFGSTSPSWLLLQSLDAMNPLLEKEYPDRLERSSAAVADMRKRLEAMSWRFIGEETLKLTICAGHAGYRGEELSRKLREAGIEPEYADPDYVVLMASPWNRGEELARLEEAMSGIPVLKTSPVQHVLPAIPEQVLTPRQAMLSEAEEIPLNEACGRILAAPSMHCPPAVSVITCGERIPAEALPLLAYYGTESVSVVKDVP